MHRITLILGASALTCLMFGCGELTPGEVAGLAGEAIEDRAPAVERYQPCEDGVATIDRVIVSPDGDPARALDIELRGRTCGAEVNTFDFFLYDDFGQEPLYLRAQSADVFELIVDDAGGFVIRGQATSSCGAFTGPLLEVWLMDDDWGGERVSVSSWAEIRR